MSTADTGALLTIDDVAAHLNITPRFARKLIATRAIPSVKIGRLVRVTPAAITEYIAAQTRVAS